MTPQIFKNTMSQLSDKPKNYSDLQGLAGIPADFWSQEVGKLIYLANGMNVSFI